MSNEVFKNDTAIVLDWPDVTNADRYQVQVNLNADFSGSDIENDATLAVSTHSFVDGGAGDKKRYWRWRHSTDTGATWNAWSPVASYWLDTSESQDQSISDGGWRMFDEDDVSDFFTLIDIPLHAITPRHIRRFWDRNRAGELLSEYLTVKEKIEFDFSRKRYMDQRQASEFYRFDTEIKTFFLGAMIKTEHYSAEWYRPLIWKVQFGNNPDLEMLAAGRPELFTGRVAFEEV